MPATDSRASKTSDRATLAAHPLYTAIPVIDLARATAWYRENLGLEPSSAPPLPPGDEGLFFDAGQGTRFYLFPSRAGVGGGHTQAEFAVGDAFDEVIAELRRRGVRFEEYDLPGIKTRDGVAQFTGPQGHRVAWLHDSEGNLLAIGSYGERSQP